MYEELCSRSPLWQRRLLQRTLRCISGSRTKHHCYPLLFNFCRHRRPPELCRYAQNKNIQRSRRKLTIRFLNKKLYRILLYYEIVETTFSFRYLAKQNIEDCSCSRGLSCLGLQLTVHLSASKDASLRVCKTSNLSYQIYCRYIFFYIYFL